MKIRGFTPMFDALLDEHGLYTAAVYGKIWRYCDWSEKNICTVSNARIADELDISLATMKRSKRELIEGGYISNTKNPGYPDTVTVNHDFILRMELSDRGGSERATHLAQRELGDGSERATKIVVKDSNNNDDDDITDTEAFRKCAGLYQQIQLITPLIADHITDALEDYGYMWVKTALERTIENHGTSWRYVDTVLKNMKKNGYDWTPDKSKDSKRTHIADVTLDPEEFAKYVEENA